MPSESAKPGRPRRQPAPAHKGRPAFWTLGEDGQLRRLVLPAGSVSRKFLLGEGDGPPADLPAPLKIKSSPGQRRPPKPPAGTWEDDDDLLDAVSAIVGKDRRDRSDAMVEELRSMATRWLGRALTVQEDARLEALTLGRKRSTTASLGRSLDAKTQRTKASAIVLELLTWRHSLTYPAVRKMQLPREPKPIAYDFTALVLKYEAEQPLLDAETRKPVKDEKGRPILVQPPVCDEQGQPILWVPDERGQPSRAYGALDEHGQLQPFVAGEPRPRRKAKAVRPRVKMIFR